MGRSTPGAGGVACLQYRRGARSSEKGEGVWGLLVFSSHPAPDIPLTGARSPWSSPHATFGWDVAGPTPPMTTQTAAFLLTAGAALYGARRAGRERAAVARRLHDGPLQGLHALRFSLGSSPDPDLEGRLIRIAREVREITEDLRPAPTP